MPPISFELALLAGRALFLIFCFVIAAVAFTRWRRAADRSTAQFAVQTATVLERITALEVRLSALQQGQVQLAERLEGLSTTVPSNATTPSYQVAIRMARSGASRDELMTSCGVTRHEADLVQRLHSPARGRMIAVS